MPKGLWGHRLALGLTLGVGVGLSILAASLVNRWEISSRQLRFQQQIENLGTSLQRSLNRYTDLLTFVDDYYAVDQLPVDRQAFTRFVGRSLQIYSGIQALEWAPLIRQSERLAYEQSIQAEGFPTFQITELSEGQLVRAADRPYYIPVTYVEPFAENDPAFGYDLYSNATRAKAIALARDTNTITATGRIRLVQEKRDQFSFLVFLPVYQHHQAPTSVPLRQQQFAGVLLGVFRVSDVVEEALQDLQFEIDFAVYDQSASPDERFLGHYDARHNEVTTLEKQLPPALQASSLCPSAAACTQTLSAGQRQWKIVFSPSVNYPIEPGYGAIATLLSGLLLTSALLIFLHQLNQELERTKSLSDLRFRFFSMASHELRTPLSTILLSSESLQLHHHQLSDDQKQTSIQRIYLTAKRMSQQIADLLMLTRAEVQQLDFQPELLNLENFCQQIVDEMQLGISQPIQVIKGGESIKAFLDKKLLRSLLSNLLSNAANYSPVEAPIQLQIRQDANTAIIQVSDRGIGIPIADQARIWETFYRGSNVGGTTGSGLGLAVVKTCVDLHRGILTLDSQEGKGTTITVQLPLE